MKKIIVLYSGGLDSRILFHIAQMQNPDAEIKALYWNYYHDAATIEIDRLPEFVEVRNVDWMQTVQGYYSKEGDPAGDIYIPGRNMVFSILSACQDLPDEIWLGALYEEAHDYATDKNSKFVGLTNDLLQYVLKPFKPDGVKIRMPMVEMGLTKFTALKWALSNGLSHNDLKATVSCYNPIDVTPCGTCPQCIRRQMLFRDLGFKEEYHVDPLSQDSVRDWINLAIDIEIANRNDSNLKKNWNNRHWIHWPGLIALSHDPQYTHIEWLKNARHQIEEHNINNDVQ